MSSEKCRAAALRYVAARMRTEGQVDEYLRRKGFSTGEVEEAIEMLRGYSYVDDAAFCRAYYREAALKGRGRLRIEQELRQKKIPRLIVRDALDDLLSTENEDYEELMKEVRPEKERALAVGRKLLAACEEEGGRADKNFLARAGRRLAYLGYANEIIYSVIGVLMKERKPPAADCEEEEDGC